MTEFLFIDNVKTDVHEEEVVVQNLQNNMPVLYDTECQARVFVMATRRKKRFSAWYAEVGYFHHPDCIDAYLLPLQKRLDEESAYLYKHWSINTRFSVCKLSHQFVAFAEKDLVEAMPVSTFEKKVQKMICDICH